MRSNLTLAFLSLVTLANAQVSNGGFEDLNVDATAQYWAGDLHLIAIVIDSNGVAHMDSVVYDGGSDYALSTDAHSGQYAMELRNGFNYTANYPIIGRIHANSDTNSYQSFPLVTLPITQRPQTLSFWSKYTPVATDSAEVTIDVFDEGQNMIGAGRLTFGGTGTTYTQFEVPVIYTTQDAAAFMQVTFANGTYGGTVTLGTRLLIDDVQLAFEPNGIAEATVASSTIELFPVPAHDRCAVRSTDGNTILGAEVLSTDGRVEARPQVIGGFLDVSGLSAGVHMLAVRTSKGWSRTRLVVAR